ncbi:hypothetical protein C0992_012791, partial [Termitomyces sp. T32_za158]
MEKWSWKDGVFDYQKIYDMTVKIFESAPDHQWVIETLKWWNENVPELKSKPKRKRNRRAVFEQPDDESDDAAEEVLQMWRAQDSEQ